MSIQPRLASFARSLVWLAELCCAVLASQPVTALCRYMSARGQSFVANINEKTPNAREFASVAAALTSRCPLSFDGDAEYATPVLWQCPQCWYPNTAEPDSKEVPSACGLCGKPTPEELRSGPAAAAAASVLMPVQPAAAEGAQDGEEVKKAKRPSVDPDRCAAIARRALSLSVSLTARARLQAVRRACDHDGRGRARHPRAGLALGPARCAAGAPPHAWPRLLLRSLPV